MNARVGNNRFANRVGATGENIVNSGDTKLIDFCTFNKFPNNEGFLSTK